MDLFAEGIGSYYLTNEGHNNSFLKGTSIDKIKKPSEYLNLIGFLAGFSILFFPIFYCIGYELNLPGFVYLITYLILVFLQFLNPAVKKLFQARKKENFEIFKKFIDLIIKNNLLLSYEGKSEISEVKELYDFEVKNSIDISGEYDMTKPPEFLFHQCPNRTTERYTNTQQNKLSSLIVINICPVEIYTVDRDTERMIELYSKNISIIFKQCFNFSEIYFRNFNCLFLLSIPFLSSSFAFNCLSVDYYNIEQKKLISCVQDLDTNYYLQLCSDLKPKFTLCNGEEIIFEENCIAKADKEKLKLFNENYSKTLCQKDEERKKLIEFGYEPQMDLYNKTLGNLQIHIYVNEFYNIAVTLQYDLKGVAYTYTYGRNYFSFQSEVNINCTKEGLVKVGELNYLYIKFLEHPIIFGDYNNLSFTVEFDGAKTVFGPEAIVGY